MEEDGKSFKNKIKGIEIQRQSLSHNLGLIYEGYSIGYAVNKTDDKRIPERIIIWCIKTMPKNIQYRNQKRRKYNYNQTTKKYFLISVNFFIKKIKWKQQQCRYSAIYIRIL